MSQRPGARLGPYEVITLLGSGGMGEVYKARDSRLDRTVAIKLLPEGIAADPDRRARLECEARAAATLSHPHICTLYDIGEHDGALFLVMEHLAGETLANRLEKGPLAITQALEYGAQIADALGAAQRAGIVHRDLKPANVMLTPGGVKLLDFGLAKVVSAPLSDMATVTAGPAPLTAKGTILGTFQYMAPEQLEGGDADSRTDIFALGAVLYEMVTGRKAFEGTSPASVIGAILHRQPTPIATLQPDATPALEHVILRCLEKSRDDRWQAALDVGHELRWVARQPDAQPAASPRRDGASFWRRVAFVAAALTVVSAGMLLSTWTRVPSRAAADDHQPVRVLVPPPPNSRLTSVQFALAPDGSRLAFVALSGSQRQLWVYSLASGESRPIAGVDDANFPFWSADGRSIAYVTRGDTLMRISAAGGPPQALASAEHSSSGAWNDRGVILFASPDRQGISRVPAAGGPAVPLTILDPARGELAHAHPRFLPDGKRFLYFAAARRAQDDGVFIRSLDVDDRKLLLSAVGHAEFIEPGYLLFVRDAVLYAQRFNLQRLELEGEPITIAQPLNVNIDNGGAAVSTSRNGSLAYFADAPGALVWVDTLGKPSPIPGAHGRYRSVELSPDATKALVRIRGKDVTMTGDVWTMDLTRGIASRLTFDAASVDVRWSPDRAYAVFDSEADGGGVYRRRVDGSGQDERLFQGTGRLSDVRADGRLLIKQDTRCVLVDPASGRTQTLLELAGLVMCGRFSEDGRYLAFTAEQAGRAEVFVVPFPAGTPRIQLSNEGGSEPRWRRDGRELFYLSAGGKMMSVTLSYAPELQAASPRSLFSAVALTSGPFAQYSVSGDGARFLMIDPYEDPLDERFTVIAHWSATLPR